MSSAAYGKSQAQIVTLANRELRAFWLPLDKSNPVAVKEAVSAFMVDLIESYGSIASTIAADYYDDLRGRAGARGKYAASVPDLDIAERVVKSSDWAVQPLFPRTENVFKTDVNGDLVLDENDNPIVVGQREIPPDPDAALSRLSGTAQRNIQQWGRDTVTSNSIADPSADGWQRVGAGHNCVFCSMLIGRGAVYTEASADFASHDRCNCQAVPAFGGEPRPVQPYTPSQRKAAWGEEQHQVERERVKAWIEQNQ